MLAKGFGALVLAAVYWLPVRRWFSRWGTTPEEFERVMPGDALISDPSAMSAPDGRRCPADVRLRRSPGAARPRGPRHGCHRAWPGGATAQDGLRRASSWTRASR